MSLIHFKEFNEFNITILIGLFTAIFVHLLGKGWCYMVSMLGTDPDLTSVSALPLAELGYAPVNPPEWIEKLGPQVVLLSAAAGDIALDPEGQAAL